MAAINRYTGVGNLTHDPECRDVGGGNVVCEFSIAINESRKVGDKYVDHPVFVPCVVWGRQAEVLCEYALKGSPVGIDGKLDLDSWEREGKTRSKLKVKVEKLQLLGSRQSDRSQRPSSKGRSTHHADTGGAPSSSSDDDIPF